MTTIQMYIVFMVREYMNGCCFSHPRCISVSTFTFSNPVPCPWFNTFLVNENPLLMNFSYETQSLEKIVQLRGIYSICSCLWNVASYKCKVYNGRIKISSFVTSFVLNRSSVSISSVADLALTVVSIISSTWR
jgi:hypothetical protein